VPRVANVVNADTRIELIACQRRCVVTIVDAAIVRSIRKGEESYKISSTFAHFAGSFTSTMSFEASFGCLSSLMSTMRAIGKGV